MSNTKLKINQIRNLEQILQADLDLYDSLSTGLIRNDSDQLIEGITIDGNLSTTGFINLDTKNLKIQNESFVIGSGLNDIGLNIYESEIKNTDEIIKYKNINQDCELVNFSNGFLIKKDQDGIKLNSTGDFLTLKINNNDIVVFDLENSSIEHKKPIKIDSNSKYEVFFDVNQESILNIFNIPVGQFDFIKFDYFLYNQQFFKTESIIFSFVGSEKTEVLNKQLKLNLSDEIKNVFTIEGVLENSVFYINLKKPPLNYNLTIQGKLEVFN